MMQLQTAQPTGYLSIPPLYADQLTRTIGVLQQLQVLVADDAATLGDVSHIFLAIQQEFGAHTSLEQVIQALVGRHLAQQIERRSEKRMRQEVAV